MIIPHRPIPRPALLLTLLLLTACTTTQTAPAPDPVPQAATVPAATATLDPTARTELPIGVQVFESDVTTDALEHLRAAGVAWARTRALWKLIEPTPGRYDWSVTDRLFGDTTAAGFRNVAVVYANPPWVTDLECLPVPSVHRDAYAALWTALVERYDGDGQDDAPSGAVVRYWQVSNEVDFDPFVASSEGDYGGCFGHDPAAYAEQLVIAYRAAKEADPETEIGFGPVAYDRFTAATAPTGWPAEPGPFVYDFTQRALEHLYRQHAEDPDLPFFDFVGLHSYNDNAHFWDRAGDPPRRELVGKVARFRNEQLAVPGVYDVREVPILISETGMATAPDDEWTERSERLQAMYVGQTMVRALAADVIAGIWYTARDNIFGDCIPPHYDWLTFGLMRSAEYRDRVRELCPGHHPWIDLERYRLDDAATPRPALDALAALTGVLRGAVYDRPLTTEETGHPAIEAYAFRTADRGTLIAAWTTTGERLGKRGVEPITATLTVDATRLRPWTGRVTVMDHLGQTTTRGAAGEARLEVEVGQGPVYIGIDPRVRP